MNIQRFQKDIQQSVCIILCNKSSPNLRLESTTIIHSLSFHELGIWSAQLDDLARVSLGFVRWWQAGVISKALVPWTGKTQTAGEAPGYLYQCLLFFFLLIFFSLAKLFHGVLVLKRHMFQASNQVKEAASYFMSSLRSQSGCGVPWFPSGQDSPLSLLKPGSSTGI